MRISLPFILLFSFSLVASSQIRVVDVQTKVPLSGVIILGDLNPHHSSDNNGIIHLQSPTSDTITFFHPGYLPKLIVIPDLKEFSTVEMIADVIHLDEVMVNAGKTNNTRIQFPGSIDIISLTELPTNLSVTIGNYLMSVPGVMIQEGTNNTSRITIRGIGSRNPYGSNRIKAYFGDIPLSNGEGVTALEDLSPESLGRIEIIKGSSPLYGSGTGGVILLYPSYPSVAGTFVEIGQTSGSFGTFKTTTGLSYKKNRFVINAKLSSLSSEGYRENNRFDRTTALLNAHWFGNQHQVNFLFNYSDVFGQIPSSLNFSDFDVSPWKAADNWNKINGHEQYGTWIGGITLKSTFSQTLRNTLTIHGNFTDHYESRPFNILDDKSMISGFRENLSYNNHKLSLGIGADFLFENYQWGLFETNDGISGVQLNNFEEKRYQNDSYLTSRIDLNAQLSLEASLTLSQFRYTLNDLHNPTDPEGVRIYKNDPLLSPRFAANYIYNTDFRVFFSYSKGYSPPSVEESLMPDGLVNQNILPETSSSQELGTHVSFFRERLRLNLSMYRTIVSNMLVNKRLTEDQFMAVNAGKTRLQGIEINSIFDFLSTSKQKLYVEFSYTISDNRFIDFIDDGINFSGKHLPSIPRSALSAKLNYHPTNKWKLGASFYNWGKQFLTDSNTEEYKGHSLADLNAIYSTQPSRKIQLSLSASIKNIFNKKYASMLLPNARAFGNAQPRYFYPGLPRHFNLGVKMTWQSK